MSQGYVYFMHAEGTDFYKIGWTKTNIKKRLDNVRIACPFDVSYYCLIQTDAPRKVESRVHALLNRCRMRGEWFDLSSVNVNAFLNNIADDVISCRNTIGNLLLNAKNMTAITVRSKPKAVRAPRIVYAHCQCGCGNEIPKSERRAGKKYLNDSHGATARKARQRQKAKA